VTLHNNANISPFSPNSSVTTINLPLQSIDFDAQAPTQPNTDAARGNRRRYLDALYSFRAQEETPLRATLDTIGQYLENKSPRTLFPNDDAYLTGANGGACQQSFVILMTDGLESGPDPTWGNTDIAPGTDSFDTAVFKQGFNGGPYADFLVNTLADVAMHYYQRDLRRFLNDIVPISPLDQARHQHMVTYTITFDGFNGTLTRDPLPHEDGTTFWPQNFSDDRSRIDDLRHAAFNGRGQFLQTTDMASLSDALRQALTSIAQRTSSASSVTLNAGVSTTVTRVFQARFDSGDWSGQLLSIKLDPTTGAPLPNAPGTIDSGTLLDQRLHTSNYDTSVRTILTYKPSARIGIPFLWPDLDPAQQAALHRNISGAVDNLGQARLAYLRGSNADEGQGNHFRVRAHRLGDIIDSDPFFVGPPALPEEVDATFTDLSRPYVQFRDDPANRNRPKMLLVGSNDGMLHIFNANNPQAPTPDQEDPAGQELLAYVPNSVLKHTVDLTSPTYRHRYYVNGSPTGGDVFLSNRGWRTVAVGGLGAGGQGYFALDITSPSTFHSDPASAIVLWEFTDADDPDLGLTFSQPSLVRMKNGKWAAVVGNGYNNADSNAGTDTHVSTTGRAMFFILFLDGPGPGGTWVEGTNYIKIDTGVGDTATPNGLAPPAAVDIDADFTVDYLVAGDLRGNLWRIDVTSANPSDWKLEANRKLLFTATDSSGTPQPITSRPEVGKHPQNFPGFVVYVGTGKYLEKSDTSTVGATTQSFYGIWDKDLSGVLVARSELVQQTVVTSPTVTDANGNPRLTRVTSDNPINWETRRGFFLDLPAPGEKQVSNSILRSGRIIFSTLIPNDQPCNFGGTSFIFVLDVHGGTPPDRPFFDINKDRLFNDQDMATVNGQLVPFSALQSGVGIIKTPVPVAYGSSDLALTSGADGVPTVEVTNRSHEPAGRQAWRKITQ
jgi:type IV pilus assembly protein PilY1